MVESPIHRVASGDCAGALVRFHFINSAGNADCRFAQDFGSYLAGEIAVVALENLVPPIMPAARDALRGGAGRGAS